MTTTTVRATDRAAAGSLPGAWRIGLLRGGLEIRQFFRQREQVVFTFAFPVVFLFLFASIFHDDGGGAGITASQLYVPAMTASGIMSTSSPSTTTAAASTPPPSRPDTVWRGCAPAPPKWRAPRPSAAHRATVRR